jgi:hypothetical protein
LIIQGCPRIDVGRLWGLRTRTKYNSGTKCRHSKCPT